MFVTEDVGGGQERCGGHCRRRAQKCSDHRDGEGPMPALPPITHRMVEANGLRQHVAESGNGPAVLLCHGWPETWYSWRHQLPALAAAGFRPLAPDMRGYGRTDHPQPIEAYTQLHIVGDMVGLLDALDISQAVII